MCRRAQLVQVGRMRSQRSLRSTTMCQSPWELRALSVLLLQKLQANLDWDEGLLDCCVLEGDAMISRADRRNPIPSLAGGRIQSQSSRCRLCSIRGHESSDTGGEQLPHSLSPGRGCRSKVVASMRGIGTCGLQMADGWAVVRCRWPWVLRL